MIKSKNLFSASLILSVIITFIFLYRIDAKEVKRGDVARRDREIERKDAAIRPKTLKKSYFKISQFKTIPREYHQLENKKYKLHAFIDIVEKETESEEMFLSGSSASTLPKVFSLNQNHPNPFNPTTTITFDVPGEKGNEKQVRLTIYDIRGRKVRTLVNSKFVPGSHRAIWDGRNDRGQRVTSGVYLYTMRSGDKVYTKKMVMVK